MVEAVVARAFSDDIEAEGTQLFKITVQGFAVRADSIMIQFVDKLMSGQSMLIVGLFKKYFHQI